MIDDNFDIHGYDSVINAKTSDEVEGVFSAIKALPEVQRKAVADSIESAFVDKMVKGWREHDFLEGSRAEFKDMMDMLRHASISCEHIEEDMEEFGFFIAEQQATAHLVMNIREIKGERVHSLVRDYAEAVSKMTDQQYGSSIEHMALTVGVMREVFENLRPKPAIKTPNPFRGKKPGM